MTQKHDFEALAAALWGQLGSTPGAPPKPPELQWNMDYPDAIERCIALNDVTPLVKLLSTGCPIHPMLLPALATAMAQRGRPIGPGRKRKLTSMQASVAASKVQMARRAGRDFESAVEEVAAEMKVSDSVVQRAYNAKYPVWLRPSQKQRRL